MEVVSRRLAIEQGLSRYFTGKPCSKGHIDYRNTCDHSCCECGREKARLYREKNKEKVRINNLKRSERRRSSPELRAKAVEEAKKWASENREKYLAYLRNRYKENREKMIGEMKDRYYKNRKDQEWVEKERERCREKHAKNPEMKKSSGRTRRARSRSAEGHHNSKDIANILNKQEWKCVYCEKSLRVKYDVDHIMPLARGGSNWPSNLQCLCPECNGRKHVKTHDEFISHLSQFK